MLISTVGVFGNAAVSGANGKLVGSSQAGVGGWLG